MRIIRDMKIMITEKNIKKLDCPFSERAKEENNISGEYHVFSEFLRLT